ncbi:MAG: GNAT family N-acetyltransferase [Acidiferrobacterales bacterium]|nr:GNAT family N-acetyltransferase [Acidiferrobacterales bacterium]
MPILRTNEFNQPIGEPVENWVVPGIPPETTLGGAYCRLEPLSTDKHASELYKAFTLDAGANWTYLFAGPFTDFGNFVDWLSSLVGWEDPLFYTVIDLATGKAVGMASYMRIDPSFGVIEVGNIHFSPLLQRTPLATETIYMMMKNVFDLGYRRFEWKCDSLNAPSRKAAKRFGFSYEGTFRQAIMYKGRNRDTAWFAVIDRDWPRIRGAFEQWLHPKNFDEKGRQKASLRELMPR